MVPGSLFFAALSELLYAALDAIGVNTWIVARRTETFLRRETMSTMCSKLMGFHYTMYHFGSQSEGTTTPGLQSDIDTLYTIGNVNIMYRLSDWKMGKQNLHMLREKSTPAQHYLLQVYRSDVPEPEQVLLDPENMEFDSRGRVLLSNRCVIDLFATIFGNNHLRRGPSNSCNEDFDLVYALVCNTLPPEIVSWFNKLTPGYWPSSDVIEAARQFPCFLVPDGHHASPNKHLEWRITPNLIERQLMFSLNITQQKCLVVLKMIKKEELIKHTLHESCKITTFHFKTALFFTLERTSSNVWTKTRLLECLVRTFQTIHEFLFQGKCPHYIVEGVDLFDGKLCRKCQISLEKAIKVMIQDDMRVLFHLQIDDLGQRLMPLSRELRIGTDMNANICGKLAKEIFVSFYEKFRLLILKICDIDKQHILVNRILGTIFSVRVYADGKVCSQYENDCAQFLETHLRFIFATVVSSRRLQTGGPLPLSMMNSETLDTDAASSRLKLASILYCSGDLQRAANELGDIASRLDDSVQPACSCKRYKGKTLSKRFCEFSARNPVQMMSRKLAFCVMFTKQEMFCAPKFLRFEMFRTVGDDIQHRHCYENQWMDFAVVDARPFMLFLQYLTYRDLGARHLQLQAFDTLRNIVSTYDGMSQVYHIKTVLHLFGHCLELEGDMLNAFSVYVTSLKIQPRNNAAKWHIALMIYKLLSRFSE